jgi:hypothetical protein
MAEKNNAIVFLVVGILVGAAAGAAIGYLMWNGSGNNDAAQETTYWYYIDYGNYESSDAQNGWISAKSDNVVNGLIKALGETKNVIDNESGFITSINGVEPIWTETGENWGSWLWTSNSNNISFGKWAEGPGLDITQGIFFYIGVASWDPVTYALVTDPNAESAWKTGGPFV